MIRTQSFGLLLIHFRKPRRPSRLGHLGGILQPFQSAGWPRSPGRPHTPAVRRDLVPPQPAINSGITTAEDRPAIAGQDRSAGSGQHPQPRSPQPTRTRDRTLLAARPTCQHPRGEASHHPPSAGSGWCCTPAPSLTQRHIAHNERTRQLKAARLGWALRWCLSAGQCRRVRAGQGAPGQVLVEVGLRRGGE